MNTEEVRSLLERAIEGYVAANLGHFPPRNPYAPFGLAPEDATNPLGAAWFYGYWARAYCRHGEEKVIIKRMAE